MTILSVSTYLPAGDLARIVAATLLVSIAAPSAVALGIAGLEQRDTGRAPLGNTLLALGGGVLALLVATGLYALIQR
ncbi:MAG TPA: hypothetical protein VFH74_15450 [Gaiellales bacterium]|nr:hypothetical protein [Gaiellales bacterium]